MSRPYITHGDVDLDQVLGLVPADGWVAEYSSNDRRPVLFWLLSRDGGVAGIVSTSPGSIDTELRAADKMTNFVGYRQRRPPGT